MKFMISTRFLVTVCLFLTGLRTSGAGLAESSFE